MNSHIIIYSPDATNRIGHSNDYVNGLISGFSSHSRKVSIVCFDGPLKLEAQSINTTKRENPHKKRITFLQQIWWGIKRIWSSFKLLNNLSKTISENLNTPVLFETFEYISLGLFILAGRLKTNYACIFHETNFNPNQNTLPAKIYKTVSRYFVIKIIEKSESIFVHGDMMRQNLIQILNLTNLLQSKVKTIPYGSPLPERQKLTKKVNARKELGLPENQKYMLAFGTLRKDKDFEYIIKNMKQHPDWHLIIAGPEGDLKYSAIELLIRKYDLHDQINIFNGFIEEKDHHFYFRAADLAINIYKPYIRHESGTAQKARTFLVPIIVGGTDDLKRYVSQDHIGWYVDTEKDVDFSDIIGQYEKLNKTQHEDLINRIYKTAEKNSWISVTDTIAGYI